MSLVNRLLPRLHTLVFHIVGKISIDCFIVVILKHISKFRLEDINIDVEEEDEEQIIEKRRKQREELLKVRNS